LNTSTVHIRTATVNDVDTICLVLQKAFASLRGRGYSERALRAAMYPPAFVRERIEQGAHVLVAETDGRIIGTATGIEEHESLHVCSVAVDPAFGGQGIARRLMQELEKIARERSCYKIFLQTAWSMIEAIGLYGKLGYDQEGYQRKHFYGEDFLMFGKLLKEKETHFYAHEDGSE
jgi:ribosomal protein S18 acetylase RimI-like enzyme